MSKPIVEAPPGEILKFEIQEMIEEADRKMKEIDDEILRREDGSLNVAAIYRKFNRAGRQKIK